MCCCLVCNCFVSLMVWPWLCAFVCDLKCNVALCVRSWRVRLRVIVFVCYKYNCVLCVRYCA